MSESEGRKLSIEFPKFDELEGFPYSLIVQRANIVYKGR